MKLLKRIRTYQNTVVLTVFVALFSADSVIAVESGEMDIKYYSAAAVCFLPGNSIFGNERHIEFGPDGSIENPSYYHELEIVCPLIRDNTDGKGLEVQVNVVNADRHSIKCRLESRGLDGRRSDAPKKYQDSAIGPGRTFMEFKLTANELTNSLAILQCVIPKYEANTDFSADGSRIISMRVHENP